MKAFGQCLEDRYPCAISGGDRFTCRPQHTRVRNCAETTWMPLNGTWKFAYDDTGRFCRPGDVTEWTHSIEVPFAPESARSGALATRDFTRTVGTSARLKCLLRRAGVILHFGAVDYEARVWVNNQFVAMHQGGYTPFQVDITDVLQADGQQTHHRLGAR
jgi:beta-galactosidase/beta-glucuronidase